ncbi:methyl-accepting chemotaxis protein [Brevundimonas sp. PAMC22021]|uniref:methyl-accepting chemotaxis protein n=1 Tax=Brevundimonas sp. PAMC22021 TaxID=2861285 RepID=UPI001C62A6E6|nr:methyl-accepting chemotaxis protein [Brevundimonas sp. PAMC22021]QYF88360.1 HAMP domain-containing protein [Brevundimonas sp. PAMC22021]
MGASVAFNLLSLNKAGEERVAEHAINRSTAVAEFRLAKQENALRGFLLSNNPYYLQRLDGHRAEFKKALEEVRAGARDGRVADVDAAEKAADEWYENVRTVAVNLSRDPARRPEAQGMVAPDGVADQYITPVEEAVDAIKSKTETELANVRKAQDDATHSALLGLAVGLGIACLIALLAGLALTRAIVRPVLGMIGHMRKLMSGDTAIEVPCALRKDEFGLMGQAVLAFRDAAIEKKRVEAEALSQRSLSEQERAANEAEKARIAEEDRVALGALASGLSAMAEGDLTHRMTVEVAPRAEQLKADFNSAIAQLQQAVAVVVQNVAGIRSGAGEISQASDDLSRRTEQQAASLEETAAALDQITATVNKTASGAKQASNVVQAARGDAETSGNVVRDAVAAMTAIESSSAQISQIIGVIDEIAFQTNLLALNAGVEAARAGDAGRGFAVVASEVRALAQRSAEAAKEIKTLISASTGQVDQGVKLVGQTGQSLQRIVDRVAEIDSLVSEIAASASEQATGLQQVNTAVNQMDQVTQQNAAMVEQSTAASHSLAQEADALQASVARFRIGQTHAAAAPMRASAAPVRPAASRPEGHMARAMKTINRGVTALKPQSQIASQAVEDGWEEF